MNFLDLPQDVIDTVIFFLPPADIKGLLFVSKSFYHEIRGSGFVWQQLFLKTFGKPVVYEPVGGEDSINWEDLYHTHRMAGLFTWGSLVGGRLGLSSKDVPPEALVRRGFQTGVGKPTKVDGLEFTLASVTAGGFSHQLLTTKGEIYSLGSWHSGHRGPGPEEADYRPAAPPRRAPGVPRPPDSNLRLNPVLLNPRIGGRVLHPQILPEHVLREQPKPEEYTGDRSNRFLTREWTHADVKFVSVSSGRCHFVALDNSGKVWSWDDPRTAHGVNIVFGDDAPVKKVVAGWDSSVAYLYGVGLVYWNHRSPLKPDEETALAHHLTVPNTGSINGEDKVVDFMVGEGFIIYLTQRGELFRNDMVGDDSFPLIKFKQYLQDNAQSLQPKFTGLSGNFSTFACFSNEDIVLLGSKCSDTPEIVEELQHKNCVSIAVGDYHFLALCKDGSLYSWGLESQSCGCLGLGDHVDSRMEQNSRRVDKPTLVEIGGKVLAITAAGWQSSALVYV